MCCLRVGVYSSLGAGWSSNSKYSLLGALRSIAQTISYEVSLAIILIRFILLILNYRANIFSSYQQYLWFAVIAGPLALVWFASCLAETNRTPFDFREGESELVSGFNTEYRGGGFALFFIGEYRSILLIRAILVVFFIGGGTLSLGFYVKLVIVGYLFVLVRATLPRFRYDKLILLAWKRYLSLSLRFLSFILGVSLLLYCLTNI